MSAGKDSLAPEFKNGQGYEQITQKPGESGASGPVSPADSTFAAPDRLDFGGGRETALDPDPTNWSNWRTRGDGYGDTACGMPFKTGE